MAEPKWEQIESQHVDQVWSRRTTRLRVPGGWLYNVTVTGHTKDGAQLSTSTVFVPDRPAHAADIIPHMHDTLAVGVDSPVAGRASS